MSIGTDRLQKVLDGVRVIGLVGGVASGKSTVGKLLEEMGALRLDADRAAHRALEDPEVLRAARQRWGGDVFDASGSLDRRCLAAKVFAAGETAQRDRQFLEQLVHPRVAEAFAEQAAASAGKYKVAVLDAPVLLEAGWGPLCDTIVFVDAAPELRRERARLRGWNNADFDAREAAQKSLTAKRAQAEECIDNSGSVESTRAQLEHLWRHWVG